MLRIVNWESHELIQELESADLAGRDLSGMDWYLADLTHVPLRNARLMGSNLCRVSAEGADFSHALLERADLSMAELRGADLSFVRGRESRLAGVRMVEARLNDADFTRASFLFAHLAGLYARNAILHSADMHKADLTNADLSGADLSGANLSVADLRGACLDHATLANAILTNADMRGATLRHAELGVAIFHGTSLAGADFTGARFSKTVFACCRDLHLARGLDAALFRDTACIDIQTLQACRADLPRLFLEGCGVDLNQWLATTGKSQQVRNRPDHRIEETR
jgi:uncharacterized protein YjbI with pentapeptide repeats